MTRLKRLVAVCVLCGCSPLDYLPEGVCGNKVVEGGEDCDGFELPGTHCGTVTEPYACRYTCHAGSDGRRERCPQGWGCGADGVCRTPAGSFGEPQLVSDPSGRWMRGADFDGDGRLDLATLADDVLAIHYFDAAGQQVARSQTHVGDAAGVPGLGDLDSDGRSDVALPGKGIAVLRGLPGRSLAPTVYFAALPEASALAGKSYFVAFDGVAAATGASAFVGDEPLFFSGTTILGLPGDRTLAATAPGDAADLVHAPLAAQFDEATAAEQLLVGYAGASSVLVMAGEVVLVDGLEHMQLATPTIVTLASPLGNDARLLVADANADGHLDVLVASGASDPLQIAYGAGDGQFGSDPMAAPDGTASIHPEFGACNVPLALGDIDGDGRIDVAMPEGVWLGSDALFCAASTAPTIAAPNGPWSTAVVADFDGDGAPDLAAASGVRPGVDLVDGSASGPLSVFHVSTPEGDGVPLLTAADFDGDGLTDLALVEHAGGEQGRDRLAVAFGSPFGPPDPPVLVGDAWRATGLGALNLAVGDGNAWDRASELALVAGRDADGSERGLALFAGRGDRLLRSRFALQSDGGASSPLLDALGTCVGSFGPPEAGAGVFAVADDGNPPRRWVQLFSGAHAELDAGGEGPLGTSDAMGGASLFALRGSTTDIPIAVAFDASSAAPAPGVEIAAAVPAASGLASSGVLRLEGLRPAGTPLSGSATGLAANWAPQLAQAGAACALGAPGGPEALALLVVRFGPQESATEVALLSSDLLARLAGSEVPDVDQVAFLSFPGEVVLGVGCGDVDGAAGDELVVASTDELPMAPRRVYLRARKFDVSGGFSSVAGVADPMTTLDDSDIDALAPDATVATPPLRGVEIGDFNGDGIDDAAIALGSAISLLYGRPVTP